MNNRSIPRASRFPITRLALLVSLNSLCLISPFIQADDDVPTSVTAPASDDTA
ncbi:TonB-dependent receptor, partial [Pseudomonas savastanoi pv. glycinea str. race 4]